jgi:hypothetical protein
MTINDAKLMTINDAKLMTINDAKLMTPHPNDQFSHFPSSVISTSFPASQYLIATYPLKAPHLSDGKESV